MRITKLATTNPKTKTILAMSGSMNCVRASAVNQDSRITAILGFTHSHAPKSRARRRLSSDDNAVTKGFKSRSQIGVVPCEVFDEFAGFFSATGAKEEVREVTDRLNVPRPHFHGQTIGLFGFGGVVAFSEKIRLPDRQLRPGFESFRRAGSFRVREHLLCGRAPVVEGLRDAFGGNGGLAGDLEPSVGDLDVFAGANLFRLVRELLVVQQPFLSVRHVILKGALAILRGKSREPVGIKEIEVIKIAAIGQGILREDNVAFAFAGFVHHRRNPSAWISASHINHPWTKSA